MTKRLDLDNFSYLIYSGT